MEVSWNYSKSQLDAAVRFISSNNKHFLDKDSIIRAELLECAKSLVRDFPNVNHRATMGFLVLADVTSIESIDEDINELFIEFWVDPALGTRNWDDSDYFSEVVDTKKL